IADERICERIFRPARGSYFEAIGMTEGETTLTIWAIHNSIPTPIHIPVRVKIADSAYEILAQSINDVLGNIPQSIAIKPIPLSGKLLVTGKVKDCCQNELVRRLIVGARIPNELVVWRITCKCDCCDDGKVKCGLFGRRR